MIYVGSTCVDLETRLKWHIINDKSQVFKHKGKKPNIELIIIAANNDKKSLKKVDIGYINEYLEKYGDKLINIKSNPLMKAKKIECSLNIEHQNN